MITILSVVIVALAVWAVRREVHLRNMRADRDSWRAEHEKTHAALCESFVSYLPLWKGNCQLRAELAKTPAPPLRAPNGRFVSGKTGSTQPPRD